MKKILLVLAFIASQSVFSEEKHRFTDFTSTLFMSTCFEQSMNEEKSIKLLQERNLDFIQLGTDIEIDDGVKANIYGLKHFETRFDLIFDDAGFCTILVYRPEGHSVNEAYFDHYVTSYLDEKKYKYQAMPHRKSAFAETKEYRVLKSGKSIGIMYSFPHDKRNKHAAILTAF